MILKALCCVRMLPIPKSSGGAQHQHMPVCFFFFFSSAEEKQFPLPLVGFMVKNYLEIPDKFPLETIFVLKKIKKMNKMY